MTALPRSTRTPESVSTYDPSLSALAHSTLILLLNCFLRVFPHPDPSKQLCAEIRLRDSDGGAKDARRGGGGGHKIVFEVKRYLGVRVEVCAMPSMSSPWQAVRTQKSELKEKKSQVGA